MDQKVVAFPEPIERLPGTETGLMTLYSAIGIFDRDAPDEPHYRTILFCSARVPESHPAWQETKEFGVTLGESGIDGITGGGPGLMEPFNSGILEGKKRKSTHARSYGLVMECYGNEPANTFLEKEYRHGHFATRLHQFARLGKRRSIVVAPLAGIGSELEAVWILQLLQAGLLGDALLILVGDMWPPLVEWRRKYMLERGTINAADLELTTLVPTYKEAVPLILAHHARFMEARAAG